MNTLENNQSDLVLLSIVGYQHLEHTPHIDKDNTFRYTFHLPREIFATVYNLHHNQGSYSPWASIHDLGFATPVLKNLRKCKRLKGR